MYKLYLDRHFKEGDWAWSRFRIYLSFSTGVAVLAGILIADHLDSLLSRPGAPVWFLCAVLFGAGSYLAWAWKCVAADAQRWQLLIDRKIAELEPGLFPGNEKKGLYTEILNEYERTKASGSDCTDISVQVAGFFSVGFRVAFLVALVLFVAALFRPTQPLNTRPDSAVQTTTANTAAARESVESDLLIVPAGPKTGAPSQRPSRSPQQTANE